MDEETTVGTAFSLWGNDEESVLDKGVGGLDPAHSDDRHVNGQEKRRERPALIRIAKKGYDVAGTECVLSERTCSSKADSKSCRMSRSPKMAAEKKRVLSDRASIRRITSTDSPVEISQSPKRIANKGYDLADNNCVLSERSCSAKADSKSHRMSMASSSVGVEDVERILSNASHSIPNRRHIEHPYNVEGKRREAMKSYPTSTPTTPPAMNNAPGKAPGRHNAWQHIIQANNLRELPQADMIFNSVRMTRAVAWALSDSGANSHFLMNGAAAVNIKPTNHPITITLPNGKTIRSTHTCNLDIPWLPGHMTEAHIVPGLAHASLISTRKFCDAGCKVMFDEKECRVHFKGELVLVGGRDKTTGLWQLPINPTRKANQKSNMIDHLDLQLPATKMQHGANGLYTMP